MTQPNCDYLFKVCMLGDEAVGKTSIVLKYTENRFEESYKMTLGADFATKVIKIDNYRVCLSVWDLGGQYRFRELRKHYFKNAAGALLLFDVTRPDTFLHIDRWIQEFYSYAGGELILLGNKVDLVKERLVPPDAGKMIEKWKGIPYYETSAKTGQNINEVFMVLTRKILRRHLSAYNP
ncbi:MAG: Rab family GTPase [Candidatus Asgardarchaeia archaeon]